MLILMKRWVTVLLWCCATHSVTAALPPLKTVFVIVLENQNWARVEGSEHATFINGFLLPRASYCRQYFTPPGLHPSLPNYLWLEAGTNFGIFDDGNPALNHQWTSDHLTALLRKAGIPWKSYQEDISGTHVPLTETNRYTPRHNPFVYFDDVTGTNDPADAYGIAHIRPYAELAGDLANNRVAGYNFITPNLCNGMHDGCPPDYNPIRQGDDWVAREVPQILSSPAYQNNGALFITWDEGEYVVDGSIGLILLSPAARGSGYRSDVRYTHSSLLRTLQEIFHVEPLLGDAAWATNLEDLFDGLRFSAINLAPAGGVQLTVTGAALGSTNWIQTSTDLRNWVPFATNVAVTRTFTVFDALATNVQARFYRVQQAF
jgi:hypothetical protein